MTFRTPGPYPPDWQPASEKLCEAMRYHIPRMPDRCILSSHWWCRIKERVHEQDCYAELIRREIAHRKLTPYDEPPKISWR